MRKDDDSSRLGRDPDGTEQGIEISGLGHRGR